MSTPAPLCAAVEVALNRYLGLDARALEALRALHGRSLAFVFDPPGWQLVFEIIGDRVRVAAEPEAAPGAVVRGAPSVYARLFQEQLGRGSALPRGLRVEGDPELLQRFQALLMQVGFDPAEILEPWLGDVAAQRVAEAATGLFAWGRRAVDSLGRQTADYLQHETGDIADRDSVEGFIDAVDALRDRAARAAARVDRLERRRGGGNRR